jgi:cysteine desulfurase
MKADNAYLDHNAATPLDPRVRARLAADLDHDWPNPNSLHHHGQQARARLEDAREEAAAALGVRPECLVFTSGGTEANNMALRGLAHALPAGGVLCISAVEHPSVVQAAQAETSLRPDLELVELPVDSTGQVIPPRMPARDRRTVASVILAQSEVGTIQPIQALAETLRAAGGTLHSDAAQALGRVPLAPALAVCDLVTLSPHKAGGPKGVGVLVARSSATLRPILVGGGQERGLRAGTEPVALVRAAALAIRLAVEEQVARASAMRAARDAFEQQITSVSEVDALGAAARERLPNTASIRFRGVDGRALLLALDAAGISASLGSACASRSALPSHVLLAMGLSERDARATVRFSFDHHCTDSRAREIAQRAGDAFSSLRKASLAG